MNSTSVFSMHTQQSEFSIRPAEREDIPSIAIVAQKSFVDAFAHATDPDELAHEIKENRSEKYFEGIYGKDTILVALVNEEIIGYIQFGRVDHHYVESTDKDIDFKRLYILTKFHSQGIGSALIDAMFANERVKNASKVFVNVWDINTKAIRLYGKYGFIKTGKQYPYFFNGKEVGHDEILVKNLGGQE